MGIIINNAIKAIMVIIIINNAIKQLWGLLLTISEMLLMNYGLQNVILIGSVYNND